MNGIRSERTTTRRVSERESGRNCTQKLTKDLVERRRRETINEGINELAKIVPGCEKNKGSILQRAVQFITQLKENETQNIEKWTLEKLLTEQAIAELSASNDKLKAECERAWREVETWKKTCQSAGLAPKKDDGASAGDN
jgi:bHLH factor